MTVTVTANGDVPQQPMNFDNSYIPDQLIAGVFPRVTQGSATITSGATINGLTVLPRGTVLGQQTIGTATAAAKVGGNTGNGTCTAVSAQGNGVVGVYKAIVEIAGTNAATWNLYNPVGKLIDQKQYSGSGATAVFANNDLHFTITDGSTDFVVGDEFDITVAAGTGNYIASVATATDGSQIPSAILADDANPASGAVNTGVYLTGEFNLNAIVFDTSWTTVTLAAPLRAASIFLKNSVSASDPT